ncbi:ABC transporter permease subunit [Jiella sp. CQZ9-1]|uniref:ABC transporter permease subunit n=1 Tax=Jiella flava TaxID=2816857 RepID=A0A939G003_9HYPH|nr:ABC transporter permease subunit [Jiella flava]
MTATGFILAFRSIPPIVWLFLIFFGVGSGDISLSPFISAVIGMGLITAANMAEIYRGAYAGLDIGQTEAATALGIRTYHRFRDVIVPQMLRTALPSAVTFAIGLLKDTSIASLIGVQEVAFQVNALAQRTFTGFDIYVIAALIYVAISLPFAVIARWADLTLRLRVAR